MKRQDFTAIFLGLITKKIPMWLPEESTEEAMLDIMLERIIEHKKIIKEVLIRNNGGNNGNQKPV